MKQSKPLQEVIQFLQKFNYIVGYQTAVFDSTYRFKGKDNDEKNQWKKRKNELKKLSEEVSFLVESQQILNLDELEKHLADTLSKACKDANNFDKEASKFAIEEAFNCLEDIRQDSQLPKSKILECGEGSLLH